MTFPATVQDIKVELLGIVTAAVWTDVTTYVQRRDSDGIEITRGRADETSVVQASKATMLFNNRDGRFSPRNPNGAYYGKIGRNTQIRVSILAGNYRFWGEVSAWPTMQDITGADVWVSVQAAGILRRLGQGASPLISPIRRRYSTRTSVVAYWPAEDGDLATSISSGLANSQPMTFNGSPSLSDYSGGFVGSKSIPTLNGSVFKGTVKAYTATNSMHFGFLLSVPTGGTTDLAIIARLLTGGSLTRWDLFYRTTGSGSLGVQGYTPDGTLTYNAAGLSTTFGINGKDIFVEVLLTDNGADIDVVIKTYEMLVGQVFSSGTGTAAAQNITAAKAFYLNPNGTLMDVAAGQMIVASDTTSFLAGSSDFSPIVAWNQERAASRISRLCTENGITYSLAAGSTADTPEMGPMSADTLLDVIQECIEVDGGVLYEPRDAFGLAYKTRVSLYHQTASATISVASHELETLQPVPDDLNTRNSITVNRKRGGSVQLSQLLGPLSTLPPPSGVGTYDESVSLSLFTDASLSDQAGWRLRQGTLDEDRFPEIDFNLASPSIVANPALVTGLLAVDIGNLIVITDPPSYLPPEDINQIAQGFKEFLSNFERQITMNCSPATAFNSVAEWGVSADNPGRYSSDGSTLAATMTTTATSVTVATTTAGSPLWLTTALLPGDLPFDILVAGEQITVGVITGTTSPQTFSSLTRSVNGVVKTHAIGESVELFAPSYYAL